jgi:hypothetical protein
MKHRKVVPAKRPCCMLLGESLRPARPAVHPNCAPTCTLLQLARSVNHWVTRTTPEARPYRPRDRARAHWCCSMADAAASRPVVYRTRQLM